MCSNNRHGCEICQQESVNDAEVAAVKATIAIEKDVRVKASGKSAAKAPYTVEKIARIKDISDPKSNAANEEAARTQAARAVEEDVRAEVANEEAVRTQAARAVEEAVRAEVANGFTKLSESDYLELNGGLYFDSFTGMHPLRRHETDLNAFRYQVSAYEKLDGSGYILFWVINATSNYVILY